MIYFVAMCDRIAQILALRGDVDPVDVRRSKAIAILANPALALALLEQHASDEPHPDDPDPDPDQPDEGKEGDEPDEPAASSEPAARADVSHLCRSCGGPRIDPERLRPRAVLYVRISELALRTGRGVAHCEGGVGPVTVASLVDLLGHHRVTVRPVIDLAGQVPVDAYEVPHAMREALRLARPTSVFPWSRSGSSTVEMDHTRPFVPIDRGGPPGQTRPGNLGPLATFGHRVKTHGRGWRHRQPQPGLYLWRTPQGYWFRTDNDGTRALGRSFQFAE